MAKKQKPAEEKGKAAPKKGMSMRGRILVIFGLLVVLVFLPTSIILFVGMLPTLAIFMTSFRKSLSKTSAVGAMNLAGCVPFVFKLWSSGNDFRASFDILIDPLNVVIMYGAAMFGYLIDWAVVGIVSSFMYQKASLRMDLIQKRLTALREEWGDDVVPDVETKEDGAS